MNVYRVLPAFLLFYLWSVSVSLAGCFFPDDQIISAPNADLPPPEFNDVDNLMAWQDAGNKLWLADIDPATGAITPTDGKGVQVDTGLAPIAMVGSTPRFSFGSEGSILIYTGLDGQSMRLKTAVQDQFGTWVPTDLQDSLDRWRPNGTPPDNPGPARIVYNRMTPEGDKVVSWREINDPNTEGTAQVTAQGGRWLGTEPAFLTMNQINGVSQVMRVDIDTGLGEQITFGQDNKFNPFIWWAPEFGDLAFVAMINTTKVGFYRRDGNGQWERFYTTALPSSYNFVSSPEAFVTDNTSYVTLVAAKELGDGAFPIQPKGPAEIWIMGIDPDNPFFRRIDNQMGEIQRSEPEPFQSTNGTIIYYTELDQQSNRRLLRLAKTGLESGGETCGYDDPAYGGAWASLHRDNKNCSCAPFKIADQFSVAKTIGLPNVQTKRPIMGAEGNLYFPFIDKSGGGSSIFFGAFDSTTGQEVFRLSEAVTSMKILNTNGLIDAERNVFLAGDDIMAKYTPDGQQLWSVPIAGVPISAQFAPDGNLIFFSWNGWVYIVEPDSGTVLLEKLLLGFRTFPNAPYCLSAGIVPACAYAHAPAVDPSAAVVYVTYSRPDGNSSIQAFRYLSGQTNIQLLWQSPILTGDASSPVLSADYSRIYVQDESNSLLALDAASGAILWSFDLGFSSSEPPVVSDNGYIMPGGNAADSPGYNFIGLVQDLGGSAQWAFAQDFDYEPISPAAVGLEDRFVVAGRHTTGALQLLVVNSQRVLSASPWGNGSPSKITGLTLRQDGWVFLNAPGGRLFKVFEPLTP